MNKYNTPLYHGQLRFMPWIAKWLNSSNSNAIENEPVEEVLIFSPSQLLFSGSFPVDFVKEDSCIIVKIILEEAIMSPTPS